MYWRNAQTADAATVAELLRQHAVSLGSETKLTEDRVLELLSTPNPPIYFHVIKDNERVVGVCSWYYTYSTFEAARGIHFEDLYIVPEYRGKGLGRLMYQSLIERCERMGLARLEWTVPVGNMAGTALGQEHGEPLTDWVLFRRQV